MRPGKTNEPSVYPGMLMLLASVLLGACSPEKGSEGWCENLRDKPKVQWTAEEIKDFANYCIGSKVD